MIGGSDSVVSDPPPKPASSRFTSRRWGCSPRAHAPFGVHDLLPRRFTIDAFGLIGVIFPFARHSSCTDDAQKRTWPFRQAFFKLLREPWKMLPPSADPAGHRHRLVGCLQACALASALDCARIGHSIMRWYFKQSRQPWSLQIGIRSRVAGLETK